MFLLKISREPAWTLKKQQQQQQQQQQHDLTPGQIAASPASSSSSMTQFCKYLASNTLLQPTPSGLVDLTNFTAQAKRKSVSYHQGNLDTELSKSSQHMHSPTPPPSGQSANDATSSSTSSSSSALSTSSSLNHLNHQNQATSNFNFFRTSEL